MRANILILTAAFAMGCSVPPNNGSPDQAANALFSESVQLVQKAQGSRSPTEAIKNYEAALENIYRITNQYSGSELAVKLVSDATPISGMSKKEILLEIDKLSEEKMAFDKALKKLQSMHDPKTENGEAIIDENGRIAKLGDLDGDGHITQDDVHKVMDREPSATETPKENTIVETYSWPRRNSSKTYDAYVVYSKRTERVTFYTVTESKPGQDDYPKTATTTPREDRPAGLGRAGNPAADKAAKDKADKEK
jgi:hypothetical protein